MTSSCNAPNSNDKVNFNDESNEKSTFESNFNDDDDNDNKKRSKRKLF